MSARGAPRPKPSAGVEPAEAPARDHVEAAVQALIEAVLPRPANASARSRRSASRKGGESPPRT